MGIPLVQLVMNIAAHTEKDFDDFLKEIKESNTFLEVIEL